MHEQINKNLENKLPTGEEALFEKLSSCEPRPIAAFVPSDAAEVKEAFLKGEIQNPIHYYGNLDGLDPSSSIEQIISVLGEFSEQVDTDPLNYSAYEHYINRYIAMHEMIEAAKDVKSLDEQKSDEARERFMKLNVELYGEPDELTYRSFLGDAISSVKSKNLSGDMDKIRSELIDLMPEYTDGSDRYRPSDEAMSNMKEIAEYLYGGMLSHIPEDKDMFEPQDIADVFSDIIEHEFGESAEDWKVVVTKATSINVVASDKIIKVPENRKPVTRDQLRGLVAHEIGVHMLRSVTGSETNLPILKTGLAGYYDSEEGLGKVMEQAIRGEYSESGTPYYTVAGLMYFDNKDFREAHEIMWRLNYLESAADGAAVDEAKIAAKKDAAYKTVFRISRGTDELPWFKDLAYYNGSQNMWKFCEVASDDAELFAMLLMGKGDPVDLEQRRILLETKSL